MIPKKRYIQNFTYKAKGLSPHLSQEKITDLAKMYDKFIDPVLRPKWLPASQSIAIPSVTDSSPSSSELARQHRTALKKRKKTKKDSI